MDYLELLHLAQRNSRKNETKEIRCYSTRFSPPKKEVKKKVSDENIKRYFEQCEDKFNQKQKEDERKKKELYTLRSQDKKIQARCKRMLSSTKSAQRSFVNDSDNNELGSPLQSYDDFGCVSQEASLCYEKLLNKYQNCENDTRKTNLSGGQRKDVNKEKIKDQTKNSSSDSNRKQENKIENHIRSNAKKKQIMMNANKGKKNTPINFQELLEIAKKNQFIMEQSEDSPEKLMSRKQKTEERKQIRPKTPQSQAASSRNNRDQEFSRKTDEEKILKKSLMKKSSITTNFHCPVSNKRIGNNFNKSIYSHEGSALNKSISGRNNRTIVGDEITQIDKEVDYLLKKKAQLMMNLQVQKTAASSMAGSKTPLKRENNSFGAKAGKHPELNSKRDNNMRRLQNDTFKAKQKKNYESSAKINKVKRKIIPSDSEYDSDLDDFIVDDEGDDQLDLSSHIKEIFGYDRSRYKNVEEDECLESSFHTELQEEKRSARIGLLEDLADIQLEKKMRMAAKMKKQDRR